MRVLVINVVSDFVEIKLYKALLERGVELELICDPRDSSLHELLPYGVPMTPLAIRSRIDLRAVRVIREKLRSGNFDVVYMTTSRATSVGLLASIGIRTKLIGYRGTIGNLSYWNPTSFLTHLSPRLDALVCNCRAVRDYLEKRGVAKHKLHVLHKGHDRQWYLTQEPADLCSLGTSSDNFNIGCVANIRAHKGVDFLLKSIALLPKKHPIKLLVVGAQEDNRLAQQAQRLGIGDRVRFLGYREDAVAIMRSCDLTIMPSVRREGVPRALLESMAVGVPAIVTGIGGMPEIVVHRQTGLVVKEANPLLMAEAIHYCVENPKFLERAGRLAVERVKEKFDFQLFVSSFISLFGRVSGSVIDPQRSQGIGAQNRAA